MSIRLFAVCRSIDWPSNLLAVDRRLSTLDSVPFLAEIAGMDSPAIRIRHLFISPEHNYFGHHGQPAGTAPMLEVDAVKCVPGRGLEGDRFMTAEADHDGQVTFFAEETWERMCEKFEVTDKGPEVFRRNIITRGADLNALIGLEFAVQGVRFLGTEESAPCYWMEQAFCEGAQRALKGHGGLRAKILTDGTLRRDG